MLAATASASASAANITRYDFLLGGSDSLTFVVDSIAASTWSTRLLRYRPDVGSMSKMAFNMPPNTNLVGVGTSVWFTTRGTPYQIGRMDLTTADALPDYFGPDAMAAPYGQMIATGWSGEGVVMCAPL